MVNCSLTKIYNTTQNMTRVNDIILHVSLILDIIEPWHGISNNVVCATSKASDQPAHTHYLIRALP